MSRRPASRSVGLGLLVLSDREEAALWRKARARGDIRSRSALFDRYREVARRVAGRHVRRRGLSDDWREDAEQFAYTGLIGAIDRYDPEAGAPFVAYALPRIRGSIIDGLARTDELGAVYRSRQRREKERTSSIVTGTGPEKTALATLEEIVAELALGLIMEQEAQASETRQNGFDNLAWREMNAILAQRVDELTEPEQTVIRQHYQNDLHFSEIAGILRLSRGRISQLHKSALHKLRRSMKALT